jgi:hypothetical protein
MEHCDGGTLAHVLATAHRKGSSIDWNNFDIGGCDGYKEPLGPTTSLMICGGGTAWASRRSRPASN